MTVIERLHKCRSCQRMWSTHGIQEPDRKCVFCSADTLPDVLVTGSIPGVTKKRPRDARTSGGRHGGTGSMQLKDGTRLDGRMSRGVAR